LPNLETKFVAANTLISLNRGKGQQLPLTGPRLPELERKLASVRHKHFAAQRRRDKLALQRRDAEIRKEIASVLTGGGMSGEASHRLAAWDPYDQNASAQYFDPEWMYGIMSGFHVVIGNPPYGIRFRAGAPELTSPRAKEARKVPDSYMVFILRSVDLLKPKGVLSFIVPNTFCDLENADIFRRHLLTDVSIRELWQTGWAFDSSIVDTLVFFIANEPSVPTKRVRVKIGNSVHIRGIGEFLSNDLFKIDYRNRSKDRAILGKIANSGPTIREIANVKAGVKMYERGKGTPAQDAAIVTTKPYSVEGSCPKGWRPLFRGLHVDRYKLEPTTEFVNYGEWLAAPRTPELFESPKILMRRTDDVLRAAVELEGAVAVNSCHVIKLHQKVRGRFTYAYVTACLNSSILQYYFERQNPQMVAKTFAEIKVVYVERLPIAEASPRDQRTISKLHDETVDALHRGDFARVSMLDDNMQRLLYQLYGLDAAAVALVEGRNP
jgi:hypothetical protein